MRLTAIILLATCLQVSASGYSQKVTLSEKNAPLTKVFRAIKKQTGYAFFFDETSVRQAGSVTIEVKEESLEKALDICFENKPVTYAIVGKTIVVKLKDQAIRQKESVISVPDPIEIRGTITNENKKGLQGVSVVVKGCENGTSTDANGNYAIKLPENGGVLLISYVGYEIIETRVAQSGTLNFTMKLKESKNDEVVVVGYGSQKKVNLTGAVASVKMEDVLGDRPVTDVASALQGAIAGLTITGGANPGASKSINIRGMTSINGGGPLILMDNVVTTNLDLINPDDIETVSVLKDAASAAIYGARAAFGVIIITTKRGKRNQKMQLNYSNNFAFEKVTNIPEKASPLETVQGYKDMGYTAYWSGQNVDKWLDLIKQYNTTPANFPDAGWVEDNGYRYFLKANDEIKDMTSSQGIKKTHNVSASGGSDNINYRFSLGSTKENGVLITDKDSYKRINVSSFVNAKLNSWLSSSADFRYAEGSRTMPKQAGELGLWGTSHPSYYPRDSLPFNSVLYPVNTPSNIIKNSSKESWLNKNTRIFSRTELSPLKGLKGIFEYTYETNTQDNESYNNLYWLQRGVENALDPSDQSTAYFVDKSELSYQSLNAYLSYEKRFSNSHEVKLLGGFNQESSTSEGLWTKNYYMISNGLPSVSGGTGIVESKDRFSDYAIRGGFYRFNYSFKDKYLFEANGRYDGSSKFPSNNRFGFFPSVSAGWNVTQESFMESTKTWLNIFKIRASYGTLGNQAIDNYQFYAVMNPYQPYWIYNGTRPVSLTTPGLIRQDFTWEKVNTFDVGTDVTLFKRRLSMTFDWYQRNTIGMLAPGLDFPAVVGTAAPPQNAADLKTNGWEVSLQWRNKVGDWNYEVGANLYNAASFITKFSNENNVLGNYYVGQQIGEIWGYVTDGFYTAGDFESNGTLKKGVPSIQGVLSHEGDIKYKNLRDAANSINQIDIGMGTLGDPGDRKIIGNNTPSYNFGINAAVGWKNFDLSLFLQGVGKRDVWIGGDLMFPHATKFSTIYKYQLDYWTPTNTDAYYGRIYKDAGESHTANQMEQTKFLQDASYLRVKNVTLSYTFPKSIFDKAHLTGAKVFFSGENMFTFTKLIPGVDPELLSWQYPQMAAYSFGVNLNL